MKTENFNLSSNKQNSSSSLFARISSRYPIRIHEMSFSQATNLPLFTDKISVFDLDRSEVNVMPRHVVSVVLPTWIDQDADTFDPAIVKGTVLHMDFKQGKPIREFDIGKGFVIHGRTYPLDKEAKAIHEKGTLEAKRFDANKGKTIVGAEECALPHVLYLDQVTITLHQKYVPEDRVNKLGALVIKINQALCRELTVSFSDDGKTVELTVPSSWILQDLTAIDEHNREVLNPKAAQESKGKKKGKSDEEEQDVKKLVPIQEIKYPIAFPSLGSKICFTRDGDAIHAIIEDYDIVDGGKRVEILCVRTDDHSKNFLGYSFLYAETKAACFNPCIVRVISSTDYAKIKDTYLEDARAHFTKQLSRWSIWKVCDGKKGLKAFASERPANKGEKGKSHWLTADQIVEAAADPDVTISSFEGGEVKREDGTILSIRYRERADRISPIDLDETIHLASIDKTMEILRLYINAANGHAETVIGHKKTELFFSTKTYEEISVQDVPLFGPRAPASRPSIDLINTSWFLGYTGQSREEGFENQTVVYWSVVDDAFKNFYIWVIRQGEHALFKEQKGGKTVAKSARAIRAMFESDEYPCLVEMFNFLCFGYTESNPTKDSTWTLWFLENILCVNPNDLI